MHCIKIVIRTKFLIIRNYLFHELDRITRIEVGLLCGGILVYAIYAINQNIISVLERYGQTALIPFFARYMFWVYVLYLLSAVTVFYRELYFSRENKLISALPVDGLGLFHVKLFSTFLKNIGFYAGALALFSLFVTKYPLSTWPILRMLIILTLTYFVIGFIGLTSTLSVIQLLKPDPKIILPFLVLLFDTSIFGAIVFLDRPDALLFNLRSHDILIPIGLLILTLLFYIISRNLFPRLLPLWMERIHSEEQTRFQRGRSKRDFLRFVFFWVPSNIRPIVIKDFKFLFRRHRALVVLVFIIMCILVLISAWVSDLKQLGSILIFVGLVIFYLLSNGFFKLMEEGNELMLIIRSHAVTPFRFWLAKFVVILIPLLLISVVAILGMLIFKGFSFKIFASVVFSLLLFALSIAFIQTNFNLYLYPYNSYAAVFYNVFIWIAIFFWPIYNLLSFAFLATGFLLIFKALKNIKEVELA